jgi:poly-gamma-glutamate synthesis protein (capsule biosynthesis protein)
VRSEYLGAIKTAGFDILSLANNHSADFGEDAVALTKTLCGVQELLCVGTAKHPEVFIEKINGRRIGFLFAHTTWGTQDAGELVEHMRSLTAESDVQVVYIHWGEEYALMHNAAQEALAHALIDAGADVIIGHHPHVVQDVGLYNGKPIFYSLGNFVFDQYWNDDVQTGLGVEMTINDDSITYRAIPFFATEHAQPALMEGERVSQLFQRIMGPGASSTMIAIP